MSKRVSTCKGHKRPRNWGCYLHSLHKLTFENYDHNAHFSLFIKVLQKKKKKSSLIIWPYKFYHEWNLPFFNSWNAFRNITLVEFLHIRIHVWVFFTYHVFRVSPRNSPEFHRWLRTVRICELKTKMKTFFLCGQILGIKVFYVDFVSIVWFCFSLWSLFRKRCKYEETFLIEGFSGRLDTIISDWL